MQGYLGLADGAGTGLFKLDSLNLALATLHLHSQYVGAKKLGVFSFIALYRQAD
jgi:hypothetical protein